MRQFGKLSTCAPAPDRPKHCFSQREQLVRGSRCTRAALLALVWLWTSGCEATGLPRGAQRFNPPEQYRAWWALTEACSGVRGDFNAVTWYVDPNANAFALEGQSVNGAWYGEGNKIVLGDSVTKVGSLVRHEMLHALLQVRGHPRNQFLGNCGDIVVCIERCVSDAGGPPDTSDAAPIVGSAVLPAAVLLAPDTESVSADSGWVTITLTLRNTTDRPVRAQVPLVQSTPIAVVIVLPQPAWSGVSEDQFDDYFTLAPAGSAGSTRRVVFDQQLPFSNTPPLYVISGMFGESPAAGQTLTVTP